MRETTLNDCSFIDLFTFSPLHFFQCDIFAMNEITKICYYGKMDETSDPLNIASIETENFDVYKSEVQFLDLVFLHGAGCPGALDPHSRDSLGNQHHTEKLSQRIALHFHKVRK